MTDDIPQSAPRKPRTNRTRPPTYDTNPAIALFLEERSRAFGRHLEDFTRSRRLDWDQTQWSARDVNDFDNESSALAAEWRRKAENLPNEEQPDTGS